MEKAIKLRTQGSQPALMGAADLIKGQLQPPKSSRPSGKAKAPPGRQQAGRGRGRWKKTRAERPMRMLGTLLLPAVAMSIVGGRQRRKGLMSIRCSRRASGGEYPTVDASMKFSCAEGDLETLSASLIKTTGAFCDRSRNYRWCFFCLKKKSELDNNWSHVECLEHS